MDHLFNRVARRRRRGQDGFTLIELLVVIAILGVLAAIVVFNVTGVKTQGIKAACATDTESIQTAVDAYYNATTPDVYPVVGGDSATPGNGSGVDISELTTGNYLQTTPPSTEKFTYTNPIGTVQGVVQGAICAG